MLQVSNSINQTVKFTTACVGLVSFALLIGCGGGNPAAKGLVPASGVVTLDGSPIGEVTITFHKTQPDGNPGGACLSRADGSFTVNTFGDGDGIFPGEYKVTLNKSDVTYPVSDEEIVQLELEGKEIPQGKVVQHFPQKYLNKDTTDIIVTIAEKGDKELKIEATK